METGDYLAAHRDSRNLPDSVSAHVFMSMTVKKTAAWVGGMMGCYAHSQRDTQMMKNAARDAGLFPLKLRERQQLEKELGADRVNAFEKACGKT